MNEEHPEETMAAEEPEKGKPEPSFAGVVFRQSLSLLIRVLTYLGQVFRTALYGDGYSPLDDLRAAFGHLNPRRLILSLLGLAAITYLLSGIYTVQPGEVADVLRYGRVVVSQVPAGLHYRLPWPIEQETIVNVSQVRREVVGPLAPEPEHPLHLEGDGKLQVISGDTNIVEYEVIVQYQVRDPVAYLYSVSYPPYQLVRDAVRASVTLLSASTRVDDILVSERQMVQQSVRQEVQGILDQYNSGLAVISVNLQKAYPPDEAAEAFRDVASAREDKNRTINEAEAFRNSTIPEARGQASRILAEARGYAQAEIDQASGSAQGFEAILAEYQSSSRMYGTEVTRYRLYLETMEKILPRVKTYVLQQGERLSLRLLAGGKIAEFPPASVR